MTEGGITPRASLEALRMEDQGAVPLEWGEMPEDWSDSPAAQHTRCSGCTCIFEGLAEECYGKAAASPPLPSLGAISVWTGCHAWKQIQQVTDKPRAQTT